MSGKNYAVVIIAAGLGTRMKSDIPKCMQPIAGKPMIGHSIALAKQISNTVIVVMGDDMPLMQDYLEKNKVAYVYQTERLGTAHAVLQAEKALKDFKGKILILYGDSPLLEKTDIDALIKKQETEEASVAVMGFNAKVPNGYGRLQVVDDKLVAIIEEKEATSAQKQIQCCNGGIMVAEMPLFMELLKEVRPNNNKSEYYLTDSITIATKKGYRCTYTVVKEEHLLGANTMEELAAAEKIYQDKLRKYAMLEKGVRMIAPETVFLSAQTTWGRGIVIEPHVTLMGENSIGDNVHIKSFSHIENAILHKGAHIGPYARLRYGTTIEENAHVGNFVELKNTTLGKGAKANHLSYLGDATIGDETNIGAGTVTCNYDGVHKHKTHIGKNSFIGSNTALVAPIHIGDNVTIGAGTTVRNAVDDDTLVVAQTPMVEKKGWKGRKSTQNTHSDTKGAIIQKHPRAKQE